MKFLTLFALFVTLLHLSQGALKRCYKCRSRGEKGDCKDPFVGAQNPDSDLETVPCSSGWCAKAVEGISSFKSYEYGLATERLCLQRAPADGEQRCAMISRRREQVLMCFCQGDLCNPANGLAASFVFTAAALLLLQYLV